MSDPVQDLLAEDDDIKVASEISPQGWLNSGNYALNWALGGRLSRGWPLGVSAEIFGDSGTGKSYLIQRAIASAQQEGGWATLDDTEGAFEPLWAEKTGVSIDDLLIWASGTVGEHHKRIKTFLDIAQSHGGPALLALDSLGALTTEHEKSVGLDKPSLDKPKKLRALFRLVGERITSLPVLYIIANHTYDTIDPFSSSKSSGGRGLNFLAHVRVALKKSKDIKDKGEIVGVIVRGRCVKNRIVGHGREFEIHVPFNRPISPHSGLIPLLLDLEVLEEDGRTLVYKGEDTGIYTQKTNPLKQDKSAKQLLDEYPDLLEEVDAELDRREAELMGDTEVLDE